MMARQFTVTAKWDEEAKVWYVADSDVPGLATEAPSVDALLEKLKVMVPEMLELNGVIPNDGADVPFSLTAHSYGTHGHC